MNNFQYSKNRTQPQKFFQPTDTAFENQPAASSMKKHDTMGVPTFLNSGILQSTLHPIAGDSTNDNHLITVLSTTNLQVKLLSPV